MARILIYIIQLYRKVISPILPPSCRFEPTCSEYSIIAIKEYGALKGMLMSCYRIMRCNPFSKGGYDPPVKSR